MDTTPASISKFLIADRAGKLSTKDRKNITDLRAGVNMSPEETAADMLQNLSEHNMMELANAIDQAPSPEQKAILLEERDRIQEISNQVNTMGVLGQIQAKAKAANGPVNPPSIMDQISSLISNLWSSQ